MPLPILLYENIRSSLVRRELFPQIFGPSMSNCGDSSSVRVCAYSNILGVHGFMLQRARLYHSEETRLVNNAAIRVDNYPIVREDPSDRVRIIASPNLLSSSRISSCAARSISELIMDTVDLKAKQTYLSLRLTRTNRSRVSIRDHSKNGAFHSPLCPGHTAILAVQVSFPRRTSQG